MARRRGRAARLGAVAITALAVGSAAVLGSVAFGALVVAVARTVVTPPLRRRDDVRILGHDPEGDGPVEDGTAGTVVLDATPETVVPGRYGLFLDSGTGYALLGDVVSRTATTVTRRVERVVQGDLGAALTGRWSGWFYLHPDDLGAASEDVVLEAEWGAQPAWIIPPADPHPADAGRWAVLVHGRAVTRSEVLRAVGPLRDAGWTCLAITYRNDPDAHPSGDRRYALGDREWRDVETALDFAVARGAREVLLVGYSMGGATVLQTASRSAHRERITGIVLDSPVIDWRHVIARQGEVRRLPRPVLAAVPGLIGHARMGRTTGLAEPVDLGRLDWVARAAELSVPTLILASRGDAFVPSGPAEALAALRPDAVTLELFDVAQHTRLWNYDPERWTDAVARFVARPRRTAAE